MKRALLGISLFIFAFALVLPGCKKDKIEGSGIIITATRNVKDFHEVNLSGSSTVYITYGADFSVEVKAFENLEPQLETRVENGTLLIQYKKNANVTNDNAQIFITMPSLTSVEVNGDGKLNTSGSFLGMEYFKASLSGSGEIVLDKGTTKNLQLDNSGSGDINSFGLESQYAVVHNNGGGDTRVNASKNLEANITSSGNIYYKGSPIIDSKISGSGQLIKQ